MLKISSISVEFVVLIPVSYPLLLIQVIMDRHLFGVDKFSLRFPSFDTFGLHYNVIICLMLLSLLFCNMDIIPDNNCSFMVLQ